MNAQMYRSRPYPNGCSGVAFFFASLPPSSSSSWLPASATEWMASASIDAEPEKNQAMNFVMAMPVFAKNAATTAFVPWDALTAASLRGRAVSVTSAADSLAA